MAHSFSNRIFFNSERAAAPACADCADAGHIGTDAAGTWDWCPARCAAAHTLRASMVAKIKAARLAPAIATAAQFEAPGLAPVVAGPARKIVPAVVVRLSAQVPGLVLERRGTVLAFRAGAARVTYDVERGDLHVVELMDGGYLLPSEREHIKATAQAYARRMVAA
jgi:hypothetical protein